MSKNQEEIAEDYAQWLATERQRHLAIDAQHGNDEYKPTFRERLELFWFSSVLGGIISIIFIVIMSGLLLYFLTLLFR